VELQRDETRRHADHYYVPVVVANVGGRTATDVMVRAVLSDAAAAEEMAELTIAFLAGGAIEEGVAIFERDPSRGTLRADVVSYLEP
jgi:uncharacterized protein (TIGR02588 family)